MKLVISSNELSVVVYAICLALLTALPAGVVYGMPIKYIALSLMLFPIFKYGLGFKLWGNVFLYLFGVVVFLTLYLLRGIGEFNANAFKEYQLFVTTIILSVMIFVAHKGGLPIRAYFLAYALAIFLSFLIKAYLYSIGVIHGYAYMTDQYLSAFGANLITMVLPFEFFRVYLQTDIISALYPFVYCYISRFASARYIVLCRFALAATAFIVLLSFSRYLMAVYFFGILYVAIQGEGKRWVVYSSIFFLAIFFVFGSGYIYEFVDARLYSSANEYSDFIRNEQSFILTELFLKSPYFGHGLGAYDPSYVRSQISPFSYEQQLLSFFPKFGVVGILVMFAAFLLVLKKLILNRMYMGAWVLLIFVGSGVFNPYLLSSNVIIIYVFIFMLSSYNKSSLRKL